MATSVVENILVRVAAALTGATSALTRVYRGRADAFADDEIPALNVRRANNSEDQIGANGSRILVMFDVEHYIDENADWETAVDALHMQVHSVLSADTALKALGRGLRCTGTDGQSDSADRVAGLENIVPLAKP